MKKNKNNISRKDAIKQLGAVAAGFSIRPLFPGNTSFFRSIGELNASKDFSPLFPFSMSHEALNNVTNFKHLLAAPAGKNGFVRVLNGRFADKQILTHADTGVNLVFGGFTIRPFDSLDYIAGAETGYTETEAGEWDLTVARKNAILLRNELGLKLAASFCHHRMRWTIEPKAGWIREVRIKGGDFVSSFAEAEKADAPFVVTGYFPDRSLFSPGVSITGSTLCDRLQVRVFDNGVFGGGYEDHAYGGDIRFGF